MTQFSLRKIQAIGGKQLFNELIINNLGQLEDFENKLEQRYLPEFRTLLTYMEYVANGGSLPDTKFKDITPKNDFVKEYEFKSKHLRIYAIKQENGKIIVFGGYKNSQKQDIPKFRKLKIQYLESINQSYDKPKRASRK